MHTRIRKLVDNWASCRGDAIYKMVDSVEYVSFDIFDTLLNDYIFLINSKYNAKVKSLINIGNDSFFKDVNNCTEIITIISNFFEQSDKTYLEIKLIEYGTYVQLDLFVESNFDKINDATNIDYFDDYAHLRKIFDK